METYILTYDQLAFLADAVAKYSQEYVVGGLWLNNWLHPDWQFGDDGNAYFVV